MVKEKAWHKFLPDTSLDLCEENLEEFFALMYERQQIWWKRNILKQPAPWTENVIFRDYKFTNIYREQDRSSQFLIHNIIRNKKITHLRDLLFKMIIYRFYNKPESFDSQNPNRIKLSSYLDFNSDKQWKQTYKLRESGSDPFHCAYLMNPTNLTKKKAGWVDGKVPGIFRDWVYTQVVFNQVHKIMDELVSLFKSSKSPQQIIDLLTTIPAVAVFMATEFYLDFTYISTYRDDFDFKWTANDHYNVGPGCSTGIRLIFPNLQKKDQHKALPLLRDLSKDELSKHGQFKYIFWDKVKEKYIVTTEWNLNIHNQEFFLCEYQKIKKMQWEEGKQRTKFIPH